MTALLLAAALLAPLSAAPRVEVLLNKPMASLAGLGSLDGSFAVTPDRFVLVGERKGMHLLGWGGIRPIEGLKGLSAFAYSPDGLLMGVRGRDLVYLDASGTLQGLLTLPSDGMGLAPGLKDRMFLFERKGSGASGLYELRAGGRTAKLLDSPEPIGAVVEAPGGRVLFAAGGAIFESAPGKPLRALAAGGKPIVSLAADPSGGRLYASDGTAVFALEGERLTLLTKRAGGALRWQDGALLLFDPREPLLLRLPIPK